MRKPEIMGKKFGRLTPRAVGECNKFGQTYYLCDCDCGKDVIVRGSHLTSGAQVSCGCWRNEGNKTRFKTHGLSRGNFYGIWRTMRARCNNPNSKDYPLYGARGIKCLWSSFDNFHADMYQSYHDHVEQFGERNTSIDRIDPNGNYEAGNCRWATWSVQANNRRK